MTIVSNTSPITNLAAIAQLDLLYQLYGTILIPQAVYAELTRFNVPGTMEVQTLSWIETVTVVNHEFVVQLQSELDPGEAAAVALAAVRPLLEALVNDAGFWMTNNLYQRILQIAQE